MKKILLSCSALVILAMSCNKEEGISWRTEKLTKGKWSKYSSKSVVIVGGNPQVTDNYLAMPSCKQDNFWIFGMDKAITMDEGATKCGIDDPQSFGNGTWKFESADTKLTITDKDNNTVTFDIKDFQDSVLVLEYINKDANPITLTERYKHL